MEANLRKWTVAFICFLSLDLSAIQITIAQLILSKDMTIIPLSSQPNSYSFIITWNIDWSSSSSNANAVNLTIVDDIRLLSIQNFTYPNGTTTTNVQPFITNLSQLMYQYLATLLKSVSQKLSYGGTFQGEDLSASSDNLRNASLSYFMTDVPSGALSFQASQCLRRSDNTTTVNRPAYGAVIVTILVGLLVGFFVALVILLMVIFCCPQLVCCGATQGRRSATVVPVHEDDEAILRKAEGRLIMKRPSEASVNAADSVNCSEIVPHQCIATILHAKTRIERHRDIDLLINLECIQADIQLDKEYEALSIDLFHSLIDRVLNEVELKEGISAPLLGIEFSKSYDKLNAQSEEKLQKRIKKSMKECSQRNQVRLATLLNNQRAQKETLLQEFAEDKHEKKTSSVLDVYERQFQVERNDLVQELRMEQEEDLEKIRKEHSLSKRMALKELQLSFWTQFISDHQLTKKLSDWLLSEHKRLQDKLIHFYDQEIVKERALLEEKAERRKTLARMKEMEDENGRQTLDALATQLMKLLKRLLQERDITPEQHDLFKEEFQENLKNIHESFDKDKEEQIKSLHQRLNQEKSHGIMNKKDDIHQATEKLRTEFLSRLKHNVFPKEEFKVSSSHTGHQFHGARERGRRYDSDEEQHDSDVRDRRDPRHRHDTTNTPDAVEYVEKWFQIYNKQSRILCDYENAMDEEHLQELLRCYNTILLQTEDEITELKMKMLQNIRQEAGLSENSISRLLLQHSKEMQKLRSLLDEERETQKETLLERLSERRKRLSESIAAEHEEQLGVRKREKEFLTALMGYQSCLSADEIHKMQQEVAKFDATLENSLALSKLRRTRLRENLYRERKAEDLKALQKKLDEEKEKTSKRGSKRPPTRRRTRRNRDDSDRSDSNDSDDGHRQGQRHLTEQLEERQQYLKVLEGDDIHMDSNETMGDIEQRVLEERVKSRCDREHRLASHLVDVQIRKTLEEVELDDCDLSLHLVKYCILEELADRKLLEPERSSRLIRQHWDELSDVRERSRSEKKKRLKAARYDMEERTKSKEDQYEDTNRRQLHEQLAQLHPEERSKRELMKLLLLQGKLLEDEDFRRTMKRESTQETRETERQLESQQKQSRIPLSQTFIGELCRLGQLTRDEMVPVVHIFMPDKTREHVQKLVESIFTQTNAKERSAKKVALSPRSDSDIYNFQRKAMIIQITFCGLFPVESYLPSFTARKRLQEEMKPQPDKLPKLRLSTENDYGSVKGPSSMRDDDSMRGKVNAQRAKAQFTDGDDNSNQFELNSSYSRDKRGSRFTGSYDDRTLPPYSRHPDISDRDPSDYHYKKPSVPTRDVNFNDTTRSDAARTRSSSPPIRSRVMDDAYPMPTAPYLQSNRFSDHQKALPSLAVHPPPYSREERSTPKLRPLEPIISGRSSPMPFSSPRQPLRSAGVPRFSNNIRTFDEMMEEAERRSL